MPVEPDDDTDEQACGQNLPEVGTEKVDHGVILPCPREGRHDDAQELVDLSCAGLRRLGPASVGVADVELWSAAPPRLIPTACSNSRPDRSSPSPRTASANWPSVRTLRNVGGSSSRFDRAVGGLSGQHQVGVLDQGRRQRSAGEVVGCRDRASSALPITTSIGCSRKPCVPALANVTAQSGPARSRAVSSMNGDRQMLAVPTKKDMQPVGGRVSIAVAGSSSHYSTNDLVRWFSSPSR